jgi:hypothetical protein
MSSRAWVIGVRHFIRMLFVAQLVASCSSPPVAYQDVSGTKRGPSELRMDAVAVSKQRTKTTKVNSPPVVVSQRNLQWAMLLPH